MMSDMKRFFPTCFLCLAASGLSAQNTLVLTAGQNACRPGHTIVKRQVVYQDPGMSGRDLVWDFRHLQPIDEEYTLRYFAPDTTDRLCGLEHRTRYYYALRGDTFWTTGFENPTTRMRYVTPEPRLAFPFTYGDTLRGPFCGVGEYSHRMPLTARGHTRTEADAEGELLLPDLTVPHALRVHSQRCYTQPAAGDTTRHDSMLMRFDTYCWYAPEARYPVFESVRTSVLHGGTDTTVFATSFYYPPDEQRRQLQGDTETAEEERSEVSPSGEAEGAEVFTEADLVPNPVTDVLRIKYRLTRDARISFSVHSQQGLCMARTDARPETAGRHETPIDMTACPTGTYTLYVLVDDTVLSLNVVKM